MKQIINIFLFIWQLPQFLFGVIFSQFFIKESSRKKYKDKTIIFVNSTKNFGISFGLLICLSDTACARELLAHEYGHCVQSEILGPFYIVIIGIPSLIRYIMFFNFKMKRAKTSIEKDKIKKEYYQGFPENWADHLGKRAMKKL